METIIINIINLEASEGMEIYNIADPTIYGKKITLAKSDSPDNWAERPETIVELNKVTEPVKVPNSEL